VTENEKVMARKKRVTVVLYILQFFHYLKQQNHIWYIGLNQGTFMLYRVLDPFVYCRSYVWNYKEL